MADCSIATNCCVARGDASISKSGCAGIYTRGSDKGTYRAFVCDDGSWEVDHIDTTGASAQIDKLADGQATQQSSYTITVTANGATQTLALDGKQISSVTNSSLTTTNFVALLVLPPQSGAGSATFTNFAFTPQS